MYSDWLNICVLIAAENKWERLDIFLFEIVANNEATIKTKFNKWL